jgi:hypothetical protein
MTTRAQLRTTLRNELNDSGGTPLWSDTLLNEWINEAIRGYSRQSPEEATATLTAVADQAEYALPARTVEVLRVEQPQGVVRLPIAASRTAAGGGAALVDFRAGVRSAGAWAYRVFAGNLILDPAPTAVGASEDARLEYLRAYAEPAADGDTLTTPATDDDVLVALAASLALAWVAGDEAKRLRYQDRQGVSPGEQVRRYEARAAAALGARTSRLRAGGLRAH